MLKALLLAALLGPAGNPGGGPASNPKEQFNGYLGAGQCIRFQNGTYEQICSPANGQLDIKNAAGTGTLRIYSDATTKAIAPPNMTTDVSGNSLYLHPANVWPGAAAAKTAGNLVLAGGLDSKTLVFDQANPKGGACPGTTTSLYTCVAGTCGSTTLTFNTICPGAGDCTTQAAACAAYKAWVNANVTGVTADCGTITGGASDALFLTANQPATSVIQFTAETAACTTYSNGTDGSLHIRPNTVAGRAHPSLATEGDEDTGIQFEVNEIHVVGDGASKFYVTKSAVGVSAANGLNGSAGNDLRDWDDWYDVTAMSTDAAVTPNHVIGGKPIYQGNVNPVNGTGGSIGAIPASGEHSLEITNVGNLAGDTLTFTTCDFELACATTVITEGAGAGQVNCVGAGLTTAQCALAFKTLLDAHATLGPATVVTCTDGTCSDSKFGIYQTAGTTSRLHVVYASGGSVGLTLEDGAEGQFLVSSGTLGAPAIALVGDTDTGIYSSAANSLSLVTNGAVRWTVDNNGAGAQGKITSDTSIGLYTKGKFVSSVDGQLVAQNSAGNGAGQWAVYPQTITCADDAGGTHSDCGGAQTITSNVVQLVCADANGCTLTLAETNFSATVSGLVTIIGPDANHVDLTDSAGVLELDGGAAFAMVAKDTIDLVYAPGLYWLERGRKTDL